MKNTARTTVREGRQSWDKTYVRIAADEQNCLQALSEHSRSCEQVLNFDRSTVKHALQNTENDWHQWLSRKTERSETKIEWAGTERWVGGKNDWSGRGRSWRANREGCRSHRSRFERDRKILTLPHAHILWSSMMLNSAFTLTEILDYSVNRRLHGMISYLWLSRNWRP